MMRKLKVFLQKNCLLLTECITSDIGREGGKDGTSDISREGGMDGTSEGGMDGTSISLDKLPGNRHH